MKFTTFEKVIDVPVKSVVPKPMILLTVDANEEALIVNDEAFVIVSFVVAEL
jgi:predicted transcriptional regulator